MKKSKLDKLALMTFPKSVNLEQLSKGNAVKCIYTARRIHIDKEYLLEVDFYSLKESGILFRIFFSKKNFISQKFTEEVKWSNAKLDTILEDDRPFWFNADRFVAINDKTNRIIRNFIKPCLSKETKIDSEENEINLMLKFQEEIRKSALHKKHVKMMVAIDSNFTCIEKLPKNINAWIEENSLFEHQYIFYSKNKKIYEGFCSACKKHVIVDYAKHNLSGVCPCCKQNITFKATGMSRKTADEFSFTYIQKRNDNKLILWIFEGCKSYVSGFETPTLSFGEARRYMLCEDNTIESFYFGRFMSTSNYRWRRGFPNSFMGNISYTDKGCLYFENLKDVLQDTKWIDSRIDKLATSKLRFDAMDYFWLYSKQNEARYFVDNGLVKIIVNKIDSYFCNYQFDEEILKSLKEYKSYFPLFNELGLNEDELKLIINFKSKKFIKRDLLLWVQQNNVSSRDFAKILTYTTPIKAMNYINKNSNKPARDVLIMWLDYLSMSKKLKYDVSSSFIVFPRSLSREHDRIMIEYSKVKEEIYNNLIGSLFEEYNSIYGFEDENFLIPATFKRKRN